MSSIKCSECGLTNFETAEHCKRCKASLSTPPAAPKESNSEPVEAFVEPAPAVRRELAPFDIPEPRASISPLRILVLVLMVVGLTWYYFRSENIQRAADDKRTKEAETSQRTRFEPGPPHNDYWDKPTK